MDEDTQPALTPAQIEVRARSAISSALGSLEVDSYIREREFPVYDHPKVVECARVLREMLKSML
jgi:hypothetical protein